MALTLLVELRWSFGNTFTFIDTSSTITKTALWKERAEALADGEKKLNNAVVEKYVADKGRSFRFKIKKTSRWFGYKRQEAVDMRHGLVRKATVTSAEVLAVGFLLREGITRRNNAKRHLRLRGQLFEREEVSQIFLVFFWCGSFKINKTARVREIFG